MALENLMLLSVLIGFCEMDTNLDIIGEERILIEELVPSDCPVGRSVWAFFWLMIDYGPFPPTCSPGLQKKAR